MPLPIVEIKVNDYGGSPAADHNMPCPICHAAYQRKATLSLNTGRFHPCRECRRVGWITIRVPGFVKWLLKRWHEL